MKNIFAVLKPKGPTSHDIIDKIRKITGIKKVGHSGTLDPLAKGVLVIGMGREATKQLHHIVKKEKEYLAVIKLGEESFTDDTEGEKTKREVEVTPSLTNIKKTLLHFQGKILQTPPQYSAIKIKGKKAYQLARQGKTIHLIPRRVEIKKIAIIKYHWPFLTLRVVTGPGVYIRSLARDLGRRLKTGAYLADLERTRVGEFTKEKALTLDQLQQYAQIKVDK